MTISQLLTGYVVVTLAVICLAGIYYEQRRKRFHPTPSNDHIFRCEKCGFVYTDHPDVDQSRCPQCGTFNDTISF